MRTNTHKARPRFGYTFVELLVVLIIVAILMSLGTGAILRFIGAGSQSATQGYLRNLKSKADAQWKAVRDKADKDAYIASDTYWSTAMTLSGATTYNPSVKAKYIELRLAQAFPQTFGEALNAGTQYGKTLAAYAPYKTYLNNLGITAASATTQDYESAVCLLMALQQGPQNTGLNADELGSGATKMFTLASGQQARGLVDGWGTPLMFTRTPDSAYNQPSLALVIVSAGPDRKLGIQASDYSTLKVTTASQGKDNLSTLTVQ
jgi:prepilin-type N-terminal cleavage/methylation domain-containing protein